MCSTLPPLITVPGEGTLTRPWRKKLIFLAPPTNAVTLKVSGCAVAGLVTPRIAFALPEPTFEPFGQAAGPLLSSVDALQVLKPLPEILTVFGIVMSSDASVRFVSLFSACRMNFTLFGFFFVPAFFGVSVTLRSAASFWATATAVNAMAVSAAMATIRYLRKFVSSGGAWDLEIS